jgi:hypothetical protein
LCKGHQFMLRMAPASPVTFKDARTLREAVCVWWRCMTDGNRRLELNFDRLFMSRPLLTVLHDLAPLERSFSVYSGISVRGVLVNTQFWLRNWNVTGRTTRATM